MSYRDYCFDLKEECQRQDSPECDIGEWLNTRAIIKANKKTGHCWEVDKTWIEKLKEGNHYYFIRLKREL